MSRQIMYENVDDEKSNKLEVQGSEALEIQGSEALEIQGSEVRGSGRTIFHLVKILGDLIDDELTVSDAHKCAGKKVDMGKRALRVASGAVNKVSNAPELGLAPDAWCKLIWLRNFAYCEQYEDGDQENEI
jgi:hypothetical protein